MLLLVGLVSIVCAVFFYCQAFTSGLARKRWAIAGFVFGPLVWPMFSMQRRMQINKLFGVDYLIFSA